MLGASGVRMVSCCLFAGGVATFIPMCWLITSQAAAQKNRSHFSNSQSLHMHTNAAQQRAPLHTAVLICLAETFGGCCIQVPTHFNKLGVSHRVPEVTSLLGGNRRRSQCCLTALRRTSRPLQVVNQLSSLLPGRGIVPDNLFILRGFSVHVHG